MNELMQTLRAFANEDDGAQVVEYALIIAVVSIALVIALRGLPSGTTFASFINRVNTCLTGTCA
jgi:pilus assembly protein Flp/PilA